MKGTMEGEVKVVKTYFLLLLYVKAKLRYIPFKTGVSSTKGFLCTVVAGSAV